MILIGRNYTQSIKAFFKGVTLLLKPQTVNQKREFPQTYPLIHSYVLYTIKFSHQETGNIYVSYACIW